MPDSVEDQINKNAAWAETFRNATVNPVQRARYQQDIAAGDQQRQQQNEAQFERTLATDKTAQDFFFKNRADTRAERAAGRADFTASLADRRQSLAEEQAAALNEHRAADLELKAAKEKLQSGLALKQKAETTSAVKELTDLYSRGVTKGSQDHVMSSLEIVANHPDADPVVLHQILGDAKITGDHAQIVDELAKMTPEERARTRISHNDKGGWSLTTGPETAPKATDDFKELQAITAMRNSMLDDAGNIKPGADHDVLKVYTDRQKELAGKLLKKDAPTQAPTGLPSDLPATAAAAPITKQFLNNKTGQTETHTLVNGQWQKAQ